MRRRPSAAAADGLRPQEVAQTESFPLAQRSVDRSRRAIHFRLPFSVSCFCRQKGSSFFMSYQDVNSGRKRAPDGADRAAASLIVRVARAHKLSVVAAARPSHLSIAGHQTRRRSPWARGK